MPSSGRFAVDVLVVVVVEFVEVVDVVEFVEVVLATGKNIKN